MMDNKIMNHVIKAYSYKKFKLADVVNTYSNIEYEIHNVIKKENGLLIFYIHIISGIINFERFRNSGLTSFETNEAIICITVKEKLNQHLLNYYNLYKIVIQHV